MCFSQPMAQTTPTNPAPYPLDQAWKEVTSDTVTPDGKTHGGYAEGPQTDANMKAYGQATPPAPKSSSRQPNTKSGANYRM